MVSSYRFSEQVNVQTVLWAIAGAVYQVAAIAVAAISWAWTILYAATLLVALVALAGAQALIAAWPALWGAARSIGATVVITAGWMALLVTAVIVAALYWHVLLALGAVAVGAWLTYPKGK